MSAFIPSSSLTSLFEWLPLTNHELLMGEPDHLAGLTLTLLLTSLFRVGISLHTTFGMVCTHISFCTQWVATYNHATSCIKVASVWISWKLIMVAMVTCSQSHGIDHHKDAVSDSGIWLHTVVMPRLTWNALLADLNLGLESNLAQDP